MIKRLGLHVCGVRGLGSSPWGSSGGRVVKLLACGEQEDRGSILGLATWIFRDWLSPASKSRYGRKIAKSTLILKTTNQTIEPMHRHYGFSVVLLLNMFLRVYFVLFFVFIFLLSIFSIYHYFQSDVKSEIRPTTPEVTLHTRKNEDYLAMDLPQITTINLICISPKLGGQISYFPGTYQTLNRHILTRD